MSGLLQGILFFAAIAFGAGMLFRQWWVAALITIGGFAVFWPSRETMNVFSLVIPSLVIGLPAFAGAALGKFDIKRRNQDPFDPQNPRSR